MTMMTSLKLKAHLRRNKSTPEDSLDLSLNTAIHSSFGKGALAWTGYHQPLNLWMR